jgi:hypothetical protein
MCIQMCRTRSTIADRFISCLGILVVDIPHYQYLLFQETVERQEGNPMVVVQEFKHKPTRIAKAVQHPLWVNATQNPRKFTGIATFQSSLDKDDLNSFVQPSRNSSVKLELGKTITATS